MVELQMVWGWQPALYLFLGGMGAGAFFVTAIVHLRCGSAAKHRVCAASWAAVICLIVGLLCLLTELTNPIRGMMLWQSFSNFSSWMTIGAWILVGALVVFGLFALMAYAEVRNMKMAVDGKLRVPMRVLAVVGAILGVGVAAYTGILLMSAPGVPLWNTALLPVLFVVSGIDTGIALVEIVGVLNDRREPLPAREIKFMEKLVIVFVVAELVVLAALLATMMTSDGATPEGATAGISAGLLVSGDLAPWFWVLVFACGLCMPLVAALIGLMSHKKGASTSQGKSDSDAPVQSDESAATTLPRKGNAVIVTGALGALVGGCALRFLVVFAGLHADPIAGTVEQLFTDLLSRL